MILIFQEVFVSCRRIQLQPRWFWFVEALEIRAGACLFIAGPSHSGWISVLLHFIVLDEPLSMSLVNTGCLGILYDEWQDDMILHHEKTDDSCFHSPRQLVSAAAAACFFRTRLETCSICNMLASSTVFWPTAKSPCLSSHPAAPCRWRDCSLHCSCASFVIVTLHSP